MLTSMSVGKGQSSQSENGTVMKCTMTKFDNDAKKCRNMENRDMQRCRDETCNAKMQDAMQDTVHNEHKQMEMLMPPKVQLLQLWYGLPLYAYLICWTGTFIFSS
jgi:hypothetical protein